MSQGGIVNAADINQLVTQANFQAAPPLFIGVQTATTTSLTSGSWVSVTFSDAAGIIADTYGGHSTSTNPTRYTAKQAGYYLVWGAVCMATNTTGSRGARIALNGSAVRGAAQMLAPASGSNTSIATTPQPIFMNGTTDYVELQGWQQSGGALSTTVNGDVDTGLYVLYCHT